MCEANVYIYKDGHEQLLMEKVDRIIPGEDNNIFMENIFGERKIIQARIREMELVHHRVVLEKVAPQDQVKEAEIWLEPDTDHGHFHEGEEVRIKVNKGYNMRPGEEPLLSPCAFTVNDGVSKELHLHEHHGKMEINLGAEVDGLIQVYVHESGEQELYAKIVLEVGHHHHHGLSPVGLPLEIVPSDYSHARMGESYEVCVLKDGKPLPGAAIRATYTGTNNKEYPHNLTCDEEGKAKIFLTARGNYLFSVKDGNIISTFTLMKSF
ncbi:MAG: CooT family nickel-binding protein [Syntrophomonas sp.]